MGSKNRNCRLVGVQTQTESGAAFHYQPRENSRKDENNIYSHGLLFGKKKREGLSKIEVIMNIVIVIVCRSIDTYGIIALRWTFGESKPTRWSAASPIKTANVFISLLNLSLLLLPIHLFIEPQQKMQQITSNKR